MAYDILLTIYSPQASFTKKIIIFVLWALTLPDWKIPYYFKYNFGNRESGGRRNHNHHQHLLLRLQ